MLEFVVSYIHISRSLPSLLPSEQGHATILTFTYHHAIANPITVVTCRSRSFSNSKHQRRKSIPTHVLLQYFQLIPLAQH